MDNKNKTYSTSQIAKIVGVHPNTVRMYEEWGFLQKPKRRENGYRVFTELHIKQFDMAKKALQIPVLQAGLRKRIIEAIKLSAQYQFDDAITVTKEYIEIADREIENSKAAAKLCLEFDLDLPESGRLYKRAEAAKKLQLTIDTIRNWEMNGLIKVKRSENGYRVYNETDINRLRIINSLRCANYSLSAILRMLNKLEMKQHDKNDAYILLNTPDNDEDIISACDKLTVSLADAITNAYDVLNILDEMKKMNPTL